jgi:hypothetical protein
MWIVKNGNQLEKEFEKLDVKDHSPTKNVNFFHLGNSPHNGPVLIELLKSKMDKNIVILHDTNLTDLIRFAVNSFGLSELKGLLINAPTALLRRVLHSDPTLTESQKRLFVTSALVKMPGYNKIVAHNSMPAGSLDCYKGLDLSFLDLPIGYHFLGENIVSQKSSVKIVSVGGSHRREDFVLNFERIIDQVSTAIPVKFVFLGGVAQNSLGLLRKNSQVSILENVSNENWRTILSHSDLAIRLDVGRNGESSGYIRDALVCSRKVIGDEDSEILKGIEKYHHLAFDASPDEVSTTILSLIDPLSSTDFWDNSTTYQENSMSHYFSELMKLAYSA